ncbi:bacteriocin [Moorena producens JHB]|uniref:Bacteriocin n=1 Tax=Moorena producens (strain JHB) TaxID=1454205 RepID=A0A9Q9STT0_MOOP1|nr:bacteriocin [Moorena producens]WAN69476.1 bacteriocin [Moorena producens JHB]
MAKIKVKDIKPAKTAKTNIKLEKLSEKEMSSIVGGCGGMHILICYLESM